MFSAQKCRHTFNIEDIFGLVLFFEKSSANPKWPAGVEELYCYSSSKFIWAQLQIWGLFH